MKKIGFLFVASIAFSTPSFAGDSRNWDIRDTEYYNSSGVPVQKCKTFECVTHVKKTQSVESAPLAIDIQTDEWSKMNNYKRQYLRAGE